MKLSSVTTQTQIKYKRQNVHRDRIKTITKHRTPDLRFTKRITYQYNQANSKWAKCLKSVFENYSVATATVRNSITFAHYDCT